MKTSEAANLVFQWIFVQRLVKHKFFHVSLNIYDGFFAKIVNNLLFREAATCCVL